jgi:hypothetical protein
MSLFGDELPPDGLVDGSADPPWRFAAGSTGRMLSA